MLDRLESDLKIYADTENKGLNTKFKPIIESTLQKLQQFTDNSTLSMGVVLLFSRSIFTQYLQERKRIPSIVILRRLALPWMLSRILIGQVTSYFSFSLTLYQ